MLGRCVITLAVLQILGAVALQPHTGVPVDGAVWGRQLDEGHAWFLQADVGRAATGGLTARQVAWCVGSCALACVAGTLVGAASGAFWTRQQAGPAKAAAGEQPEESGSAGALREEAAARLGPTSTLEDYDYLLRTVAKEAAQRLGPTLARGQMLRSIFEQHVASLADQGKTCLLNQLQCAAGDVCEAIDAPEAMLLLEMNSVVGDHLPPCDVLLAGLLAPLMLSLNLVGHLLQMLLVLLPVAVLLTVAAVADWGHPCGAMPSLHAWVFSGAVLAYALLAVRGVLVVRTRLGQASLARQTKLLVEDLDGARIRSHGATQSLGYLRKLFMNQVFLLQQAVVIERGVRHSPLRHVIAALTLAWLCVIGWGFVLMVAGPLPPGPTHDVTRSCSAWASVTALRLTSLLLMALVVFNVTTLLHWLFDCCLHREAFAASIVRFAAGFDQNLLGVPVVQILVRIFVLRGTAEPVFSRLAAALLEQKRLAEEIGSAQGRLQQLQQALLEQQATVTNLKKEADDFAGATQAPAGAQALAESVDEAVDLEAWREKGREAIAAARQKAGEVKSATTTDLEEVLRRLAQSLQEAVSAPAVAGTAPADDPASGRGP